MTVPPDQPNPYQGQPYPPAGQPSPSAGQPYPPAGQPYPPAGQPYPPAGQPYPAAGQPTPASKKNFFTSVLGRILVVAVVAAVGVGFWAWQRSGTAATASVGDCFSISGSTSDASESAVDCSDPEADFIVTETRDGNTILCEDGEYDFTASGGRSNTALCLRPNVQAGDCWNEAMGSAVPGRVPCSDAGTSTFKFASVHENSSDASVCGPDSETSFALVLAKRSVVYCITLP